MSHGHGVIALVRDDTQAVTVAQRGAKAVVVDLYDTPAVIKVFNDADAARMLVRPYRKPWDAELRALGGGF